MPDMNDPQLKTVRIPEQVPAPVEQPPDIPATLPAGADQPILGASNALPPAPTQAAPPRMRAESKQLMNESRLGKIAGFLLGGRKEYSADPTTGEVKETYVKNKPGDLFRHIVAGAILGGLAGAKEKEGDFWTGAGAGGEAVVEGDEKQERDRRTLAVKNAEMQQTAQRTQMEKQRLSLEEQRLQMEKTQLDATIQLNNIMQKKQEDDANLKNKEILDKEDYETNTDLKKYEEAGGIIAKIPNNGVMGNGEQFNKDYLERKDGDPPLGKFAPPGGFHTKIFKTRDKSGLTYDLNKKEWVDSKTQQPVDLKDRTTWTVMYVKDNPEPIRATRKELMKRFPTYYSGRWTNDLDRIENVDAKTWEGIAHSEAVLRLDREKADLSASRAAASEAMSVLNQRARGLAEDMKNEPRDQLTRNYINPKAQENFDKRRKELEKAQIAILGTLPGPLRKVYESLYALPELDNVSAGTTLDIPALQSKVPDWNKVPSDRAILADKDGNLAGMVPRTQLDAKIKEGLVEVPRPKSNTVADPQIKNKLQDIPPDKSLVASPDGTQILDNEDVDAFLKNPRNKEYKLVGKGQKFEPSYIK